MCFLNFVLPSKNIFFERVGAFPAGRRRCIRLPRTLLLGVDALTTKATPPRGATLGAALFATTFVAVVASGVDGGNVLSHTLAEVRSSPFPSTLPRVHVLVAFAVALLDVVQVHCGCNIVTLRSTFLNPTPLITQARVLRGVLEIVHVLEQQHVRVILFKSTHNRFTKFHV